MRVAFLDAHPHIGIFPRLPSLEDHVPIPIPFQISRVARGAILSLGIGCTLATPLSGQSGVLETDPFAVHLLGEWSGSGVYDGNRLDLTRSWALDLGGRFLRADMGVDMPNGVPFSALMYWKISSPGRYEVVWMDGIGRMQALEARVDVESGLVATEYVDDLAEEGPERRRWEYERTGPDSYVERLFRLVRDRRELLAEWTFTRASEPRPSTPRTPDEKAVLAAAQQFFDTMASRDVDGAAAVLDPAGDFVSVRWDSDGTPIVRRATVQSYLESLETDSSAYLERMWDAEVRIQGPIAAVWAPYDFHVDGDFSHCGMDAFQLLLTDKGWIVTGATYTVERTGCSASPLGPPGARR